MQTNTGLDEARVEKVSEQIAREVMSSSFGLPVEECSGESNGALLIREGIRRYAAVHAAKGER